MIKSVARAIRLARSRSIPTIAARRWDSIVSATLFFSDSTIASISYCFDATRKAAASISRSGLATRIIIWKPHLVPLHLIYKTPSHSFHHQREHSKKMQTKLSLRRTGLSDDPDVNNWTVLLGVDLGKLYDYDIILLDLNLPDMSGFEVLRSLRMSKVKTPILILSGLAGIEDKVRGLGFGADDYVTKPFHKNELVARIHAIVRRSKGHAQSVIQTGDLVVNLDTKTVEVNGARVHLTGKEYQMLELLSLRKGTTLTKEMFLNHLYDGMDEPEIKIIDVFICKLRKKLANASDGKDYIETVWGRGYVLREPSEEEVRGFPPHNFYAPFSYLP